MPLDALTSMMLESFKKKVQSIEGGERVELRVFGSRARGDAREDSDLDVLVLTDNTDAARSRAIYEAAGEVQMELEVPIHLSPLVMTREHFEFLQQRERRLALDILREGILV